MLNKSRSIIQTIQNIDMNETISPHLKKDKKMVHNKPNSKNPNYSIEPESNPYQRNTEISSFKELNNINPGFIWKKSMPGIASFHLN